MKTKRGANTRSWPRLLFLSARYGPIVAILVNSVGMYFALRPLAAIPTPLQEYSRLRNPSPYVLYSPEEDKA